MFFPVFQLRQNSIETVPMPIKKQTYLYGEALLNWFGSDMRKL